MKKLVFAMGAAVILGTGCSGMGGPPGPTGHQQAQAQHGGRDGMMTKMDANGDGMISKDEFMKAHEAMFDRMKGPNGMISLQDMQMHRQRMMERHHGMGQDRQMPGMDQGTK